MREDVLRGLSSHLAFFLNELLNFVHDKYDTNAMRFSAHNDQLDY